MFLHASLLFSAVTDGAAGQIQDHILSVPPATVKIFKNHVTASLREGMAGLSAMCLLLLFSSASLCSGQYSSLSMQLDSHLYIEPMKCWDD